jgi:hypothetical protein
MRLVNAAAYSIAIPGDNGSPGEETVDGIRDALSERGKIFSMTHRSEDDRLIVEATVSIGSGSRGPEKVIERILGETNTQYEIIRKELFVEQDGTLGQAFATERQQER